MTPGRLGRATGSPTPAKNVFRERSGQQSRDRNGAILPSSAGPLPYGRGSERAFEALSKLFPAARVRAIQRKLLAWYERNARDLPWRREADVYARWVAEIMLQQTRVGTVVDYYERFVARFPTVEALAAAKLDEVLSLWQGLGYYRRAENLHRAAGLVVAAGNGWPRSADEWRTLPGVGDYTGAAMASVGWNEPVAAVDGNVMRVLARLGGIASPLDDQRTRRTLSALARRLLARDRPGDCNQAWMDLGATVCRPRDPRCDACPLSGHCAAARQAMQDELPVRRERREPKRVERVVAAMVDGDRLLLCHRPRGGRWSGLWELPNVEGTRRRHRTALAMLFERLSWGEPDAFAFVGTVPHELTHRSYRFHVYVAHVAGGFCRLRRARGLRWARRADLARLPMGSAQRRILERLKKGVRIIFPQERLSKKRVSGSFCRNGPKGAAHKMIVTPFFLTTFLAEK